MILPMLAVELMLQCTNDVDEQIDAANADIPGAFMQADMIGNVHVVPEVKIVELLAKNDLKAYENFMDMEHSKKVCL